MRFLFLGSLVVCGGVLGAVEACDSSSSSSGGGTFEAPDGSTFRPDATTPPPPSPVPDDASPDADADADAETPHVCVDAGMPADAGCFGSLDLFNTGVGATRVTLDGGSVDPHYTLIQSAEATLPGPNAIVVSQIADGYWIPESADSKWIAPSENQSYPGASPCNASGTYVYRTTFSLAGYDPASAAIQGQWAADNSGTAIRLNGTSLGLTAPGYSPFTTFTIDTGFVAGTNTLEFEINDTGCPNGLRVEISGYARYAP
jgi:hypothetical protein